jgi:hypothetical protein
VLARKTLLLRLDPAVHDALTRWAADELRSTNAQIEFLLRRALAEAARLPDGTGRMPRRGRPPKLPDGPARDGDEAGMLPGAGPSAREDPHESGRSSPPLQEP